MSTSWRNKLPHLDRPVQTTRNEVFSVGRKRNRVDGILVALRSLEALDKVAIGGIPDPDTLVKRPGGYVFRVWRNSNRGDTILNAQGQDVLARFNVPQANRAVTTTRCDGTAITGEIK